MLPLNLLNLFPKIISNMRLILLSLCLICALFVQAQLTSDYAVLISAEVSPSAITLHWPAHVNATEYRIYKKGREEVSWGTPVATYDGTAVTYTDTDVEPGIYYNYKVARDISSGITGEGYVLSGIEIGVTDYRGTCLLVVDTTIIATIENELYRFKEDISGDGWGVRQLSVARDMTPIAVHEMINTEANLDTTIHAIVLLGRVPVLYSGNMYPDGHPEHQGAWPADGIYGDIDADYTDETINNTIAGRTENWNVPGDGKYDQNVFKSRVDLQVGRIDMFNLPVFGVDEAVLLKRYLDNNHQYRNGITRFTQRALIDDNFGAFAGEAFAASGWRNFGPLIGNDHIAELDFFPTMRDSSYVWSYGCGGGWFQGASGVGTSTDFAADTTKTVFSFLFGSYFGDWDSPDNFLRASLAGGTTLTNAWAGRPHWQTHEMGMGATIGEAARLTQNNNSTYISNLFPKWTHISLLGDPTLRMYPVSPVEEVMATLSDGTNNQMDVDIVAGDETGVLGYHIFLAQERFGIYTRVTETPVTFPQHIYAVIDGKAYPYVMVRPVTLETTPSGSFYNMGTGIVDSADVVADINQLLQPALQLFPNPASSDIYVYLQTDFQNKSWSITSIAGVRVAEGVCTQSKLHIALPDLAPGVYTFTVANLHRQFVVVHE